jgi:hypothetical protein
MRSNSDTVAPHYAITGMADVLQHILQRTPHSGITVLVAVGWVIAVCGIRDHCYGKVLHFLIDCTVH